MAEQESGSGAEAEVESEKGRSREKNLLKKRIRFQKSKFKNQRPLN
jgi:hypothetical protein